MADVQIAPGDKVLVTEHGKSSRATVFSTHKGTTWVIHDDGKTPCVVLTPKDSVRKLGALEHLAHLGKELGL